MIIISNYRLKHNIEEDIYYVETDEEVMCPVCSNDKFHCKGRRKRIVINPGDIRICLVIRRLICERCKKIHHELPDIIVPYKRHCAETIEEIVSGSIAEVCCYWSTVLRIQTWWTATQLYITSILESIKKKYGIVLTEIKKLPGIVRALVNTHFWPGTRSAMTPPRK